MQVTVPAAHVAVLDAFAARAATAGRHQAGDAGEPTMSTERTRVCGRGSWLPRPG